MKRSLRIQAAMSAMLLTFHTTVLNLLFIAYPKYETCSIYGIFCTGSSEKMDGIWNRYNLKSTRRIYTFGVVKCSEKFKVLDVP